MAEYSMPMYYSVIKDSSHESNEPVTEQEDVGGQATKRFIKRDDEASSFSIS